MSGWIPVIVTDDIGDGVCINAALVREIEHDPLNGVTLVWQIGRDAPVVISDASFGDVVRWFAEAAEVAQ